MKCNHRVEAIQCSSKNGNTASWK